MNTYNFDSTGLSPDNRVSNEKHTVSTVNASMHNYFVPRYAPFFANNFVIIDTASGEPLELGDDYVLTHKYEEGTFNVNQDIYGSVTLKDPARTGTFSLVYQTLGGDFTNESSQSIENGLALLHDLTTIDWSELTSVPETFPLTPHNHPVTEVEAVTEMLSQLTLIREAIANPYNELTLSDITDLNENFIRPVIDGIDGIAAAIIQKAASTNIPFEISTPGQTKTDLGSLNIGSWRSTSLGCECRLMGTYKIDFDVNVELVSPTAEDIKVEKRWTVNNNVIDRSYANHTAIGLTVGDVVRMEIRLVGGSADNVIIADTGHTSSLTITRLGD